ncbi:hypothetical protein [Saccharopolyspora shandongensis]|uniref:hypothetical protein n=1 Tax=Saccharopolyspora shandongensis TaxID=418495 RepID=UPI0033D59712
MNTGPANHAPAAARLRTAAGLATHAAGLDAPRDAAQLRLRDVGTEVPVEDIARLVGHSGTRVTELVYRKQIRPMIVEGATAMDSIFQSPNSKR